MSDAKEESLSLLRSIDASLKSMDGVLKQLLKQRQAATPKPIASDQDLDGKWGDPVLKFSPRDWTGAPFKNSHYSQCPPALLDLVADSLDWFAQEAERKGELTTKGKPVAEFRRADAARARGWAKRMRDGKHQAPVTTAPADDFGDQDASGFGDEQGGWS